MNTQNIFIVLFLALTSCASNHSGDYIYDLRGQWITVDIRPNFIHAVVKFPMMNSDDLEERRIDSDFELQFRQDSKFRIKEMNGHIKNGTYKLINDTIVFTLDSSSHDWLKFRIDSIYQDKLYLNAERILFQSIINKDTIEFMTGEDVQLTLKKK